MTSRKLYKLVVAATLAAMTCLATLFFQFKLPGVNSGYIHPGDGFVILSGIILGPLFGGLSAGIGSMLADILSGYFHYAVATFLIKLLAAVVAAIVYRHVHIKKVTVVLAGFFGGVVVTAGYFIFEYFLYGTLPALSAVPYNLLQNIMGIVISALVMPLLLKVPDINDLIDK